MLRPMFPYYGSKWLKARLYPSPVGRLVVEPFAGAAGYSLWHEPAEVLLLDIDPVVAGVWAYLISATGEQIAALPDLLKPGDTLTDYLHLPPATRHLIGFWLNRGSAVPKLTRTAYSARTDRSQLTWGPRAKDRIISQLDRIRHWHVRCEDYRSAGDLTATWFFDPPYHAAGKHYRHSIVDQVSLANFVLSRRGAVVACDEPGANYLPFATLGRFKSTRGQSSELVYQQGF